MIRGTTAVFKFTLPHELRYITEARVVFWQEGYVGTVGSSLPITKIYTAENDFVGNTSKDLFVVLTGAETKAFTDKLKARVQMKAFTSEYKLNEGQENEQTIAATTLGTRPQLFTVYPMDNNIMDGIDTENINTSNGYIILNGGNIIATEVAE